MEACAGIDWCTEKTQTNFPLGSYVSGVSKIYTFTMYFHLTVHCQRKWLCHSISLSTKFRFVVSFRDSSAKLMLLKRYSIVGVSVNPGASRLIRVPVTGCHPFEKDHAGSVMSWVVLRTGFEHLVSHVVSPYPIPIIAHSPTGKATASAMSSDNLHYYRHLCGGSAQKWRYTLSPTEKHCMRSRLVTASLNPKPQQNLSGLFSRTREVQLFCLFPGSIHGCICASCRPQIYQCVRWAQSLFWVPSPSLSC